MCDAVTALVSAKDRIHKSFLVCCLNNYAHGTINFVSINSKTRKSNEGTCMHHATSPFSYRHCF